MTAQVNSWPRPVFAWTAVIVLHLAYLNAFVDRTILALLVGPIKADLGLTDTQFSLVTGLAFGLFYATMGLPLGWLADRMSRKKIMAAGLTFWSTATVLCGAARDFTTLFLARMGVGVGEATLSPSAISLISDSFPKERRSLALGIYQAASSIGVGVALLAGGAVIAWVATVGPFSLAPFGEIAAWRLVFVIVGVPGFVLAVVVILLVEPTRKELYVPKKDTPTPSLFFKFLLERAGVVSFHLLTFSLFATFAYGVLAWAPEYFIRIHGWDATETGYRYGIVFLILGALGAVLGGLLSNWLSRRGKSNANALVMMAGVVALVPFSLLAFQQSSPWIALFLLGGVVFFLAFPSGVSLGLIADYTPGEFRGRMSALYYFTQSVIGSIFGPLIVALFTDFVFSDEAQLGSALAATALLTTPLAAVFAILTWRFSGSERRREPAV
ncbi:MAG: MFS transporter [Henriciella sp.]|nr:MFS transporter [Henriciella sp.]